MNTDVELALLRKDLSTLAEAYKEQKQEIELLKAQDSKRMRSAVIMLGGLVLSLLSYIWFYVTGAKP